MHDRLRSALADDRVERLADVAHVQASRQRAPCSRFARREIVDDVHLVASAQGAPRRRASR
jgi:hypothetical protein